MQYIQLATWVAGIAVNIIAILTAIHKYSSNRITKDDLDELASANKDAFAELNKRLDKLDLRQDSAEAAIVKLNERIAVLEYINYKEK